MKKILHSSILLIVFAFNTDLKAQCPLCIPDLECGSEDGFPTVCPFEAPIAYTGEYYEESLTVFIPSTFDDPGSGITATILEVTFTNASGVPYGLEFTLNDPDSTYYPSEGENHGCATICGTPLLPGTYNIQITVSILAEAFGFEVTQVQSFPYLLVVEPGEGGTGSFTYDNPAACGGLEVNFEATVVAPDPAITSYEWDFGNGQQSTEQIPGLVTYDTPGDYEVILTTTVSNLTLMDVSVSTLSNNWDGDIDDFISPPADPYFIVTDGSSNMVYTSTTASNTTSTTWGGVSLTLTNPPYSIQFFDSDDATDDDDLGTATLVMEEGINYFDLQNGTTGTFEIGLLASNVVADTAVVSVFPAPDVALVATGNILSLDGGDLSGIMWYLNGAPTDSTGNSITMSEGGQYYATVTNVYGCEGTSDTYLFCPAVTIQLDAPAQEVYVQDIYETYQWYYNGLELPGEENSYVDNIMEGNYAVEVTTDYGCTTMSEVFIYSVGVEENAQLSFVAFPNPVSEQLYIRNNSSPSLIRIVNISGQVVYNRLLPAGVSTIDMKGFPGGVYILEFNQQRQRIIRK